MKTKACVIRLWAAAVLLGGVALTTPLCAQDMPADQKKVMRDPGLALSDAEIQNAWLLYNKMDDAALYRQLMDLGGRTDLTADQRRTIQTIWTSWAVRRATQAAAAGNSQQALAILNAAALSFPDNPAAAMSLANGYAQAGRPEAAVKIYKSQNMTSASAIDVAAAVHAALAAGDNKDAELWLRYALAAYPADPRILILAAKFEQARGDTARAIEYYRASLKAMPPQPDAAVQAVPDSNAPGTLPRTNQPQDLSLLLAPGTADSAPIARAPGRQGEPYLPSYSSNPATPAIADGSTPTQSGPQPTSVSTSAPPAPPVRSPDQIHGPYAPYKPTTPPTPPTQATQPPGSSAVPVQLGETRTAPPQAQSEVTDVLPTARYAQSSRAEQAAAAQPEVAAARAARIRRMESDPAAVRTGQSHPPAEDSSTGAAQVPQPAKMPSGKSNEIPDTSSQQYPQPRTRPASGASASRPANRPPASTADAGASTEHAEPVPAPLHAAVEPTPLQPVPSVPSSPQTSLPPAIQPESPAAQQPNLPGPISQPATDAELMARNLPALLGYYAPQAPIPLTGRQHAENELASLEGSFSGWLGATGIGRYRSGTSGLDRLYEVEAPVEASTVIGQAIRLTAVALPVFLNSGPLNSSILPAGYVPYLGTLAANTANPPAQQYSSGVGGELQLTTKNLGLAAGYTPYDFLVRSITGRFRWSPFAGHLSLSANREPVKDTQLSYAGLRDPGVSPAGPIWGGVVSTTGGIQLDLGSAAAGFYISGDGGVLEGRHVLDNTGFEGATGAHFRVKTWPGYGSLSLGGALSGMHYAHNETGLTYGQGGYFSPDSYFLVSVPVSLNGSYHSNFHYAVAGSIGVETFQQDQAPYYPLDPALQQNFLPASGATCGAGQTPSYNCGSYPFSVTTLFNYSLDAEASCRVAEHWYGGAFLTANNSRNYDTVSAGFFFRYTFRAQHSSSESDDYPKGLFPVAGFRSLRIP
jgi:tetratricopeptide (TPR) repeat protein